MKWSCEIFRVSVCGDREQAKALWNLLGQNLAQYEQAFGAINLDPTQAFPAAGPGNGPIH